MLKLLHNGEYGRKARRLLACGIGFAHLARWQVRGTCFYWQSVQKEGFNPHTAEQTLYTRRVLVENEDLEASLRTLEEVLPENKVKEKLR